MFAIVLITTIIAVVVLIAVFTFTDGFRAAVVTCVILVAVYVISEDLCAAVIAFMVLVDVHTFFQDCSTSVVTDMVLIRCRISMDAHISLATVAVTLVISVLVNVAEDCAGGCATLGASCGSFTGCITVGMAGYVFLAAYVTLVIPITGFIGTGLQNFTAAVITDVIFIGAGICVSSEVPTTSGCAFCTIVAIVVEILVFASAN